MNTLDQINEYVESAPEGGGDFRVLLEQLARARRAMLDADIAIATDQLLAEVAETDISDVDARRRAEIRVREFCFQHGLLSVLALSGMPLVYDLRRSYDDNLSGPWASVPDIDPTAETPRSMLLGVEVGYPLGVAASSLTATARHIEFYARYGFNVLTYKTVRSRATNPHPFPNWVYVEGFQRPARWDDLIGTEAVGDLGTYLDDPAAYSMANSFGVPSPPPDIWQEDVRASLERLGPGKLLIVSVIGTSDGDERELAEDFATTAMMAVDAGAHAVELNLSCPNTIDYTSGEMLPPISESPSITKRVVETVRDRVGSSVQLVAKLGYLPRPELDAVLSPISSALNAVSGINTVPVRVVDHLGQPTFRGTVDDPGHHRALGGLSGVAIRDLGQDFVRNVAELRKDAGWDLQIIGMGGVMTPDDVRRLRLLGADAVQTATAASHNPRLPAQVVAAERDGVTEEDAIERVKTALRDERWHYRTIEGLAEDTNIDPALVRGVLERHPELVRRTSLRDPHGRIVYVPSDRSRSSKEWLAGLRDVLTG